MIPRVVAAEVHLAVSNEVTVRAEAGPQHERERPEEDQDVIPPPEDVEGRSPVVADGVGLLTHYTKSLPKPP